MTSLETLQSDWGLDLVGMVCNECGWNYVTAEPATRFCPHCSRGKLELFELDDEHLTTLAPPELVLPYRVGREQMARIIEQFARDIPYPPVDLNAKDLSSRVQRVFLPMWLVDGTVRAQWQAQAGYTYQVESHKSSYQNGQWRSQKVNEDRVEWEDRAGQLQREYQNVDAPALDQHRQLMQQLGRYDINQAENYSIEPVRKSLVRLPNRSTDDAFPEAKEGFRSRAAEDVKKATEAENIRDFKWQAGFQNLHWTQLLLPVYMTYYQDDEGIRRVVYINGFSGQPSGERRGSMRRARQRMVIGLGMTAVIVVVAVVLVLANPAWDEIAAGAAIIAILFGTGSLFPVGQVWMFNNREEEKSLNG